MFEADIEFMAQLIGLAMTKYYVYGEEKMNLVELFEEAAEKIRQAHPELAEEADQIAAKYGKLFRSEDAITLTTPIPQSVSPDLGIDNLIQHVSYDAAALGYEK